SAAIGQRQVGGHVAAACGNVDRDVVGGLAERRDRAGAWEIADRIARDDGLRWKGGKAFTPWGWRAAQNAWDVCQFRRRIDDGAARRSTDEESAGGEEDQEQCLGDGDRRA